jgi:hypothetical protein
MSALVGRHSSCFSTRRIGGLLVIIRLLVVLLVQDRPALQQADTHDFLGHGKGRNAE